MLTTTGKRSSRRKASHFNQVALLPHSPSLLLSVLSVMVCGPMASMSKPSHGFKPVLANGHFTSLLEDTLRVQALVFRMLAADAASRKGAKSGWISNCRQWHFTAGYRSPQDNLTGKV